MEHQWPKSKDEHVWTKWKQYSRTQLYRQCVHPDCAGFELKDKS